MNKMKGRILRPTFAKLFEDSFNLIIIKFIFCYQLFGEPVQTVFVLFAPVGVTGGEAVQVCGEDAADEADLHAGGDRSLSLYDAHPEPWLHLL